jgi:phage baseplate assembly protein V
MSDDVFDRLFAPAVPDSLFHGVSIGIVTNNKDPDGLGRVKVRLPWLSDETETDWARIASPMAGKDRGMFFLPEVDDEVLVAFLHGSSQFPYVLGGLWGGKDHPPEANQDGKNDVRVIKSRSGHVIRLTDKDGAEKIEIIDKSTKNSIVIDTAGKTVTITAEADITIESKTGKLTLKGKGVEINSQAEVTIQASSKADVKSNGPLNLKGQMVNIN